MNKPSRRAVVRTGVWAVPAVATVAAAPAFAGSPGPPVTVSATGQSCKDQGEGQNTKDYEFKIYFTNTTNEPQTVTVANFAFKGRDNTPDPSTVVVPANAVDFGFLIKVFNFDDSSTNNSATITYTVLSSGTTVYTSSVGFDKFLPCQSHPID